MPAGRPPTGDSNEGAPVKARAQVVVAKARWPGSPEQGTRRVAAWLPF